MSPCSEHSWPEMTTTTGPLMSLPRRPTRRSGAPIGRWRSNTIRTGIRTRGPRLYSSRSMKRMKSWAMPRSALIMTHGEKPKHSVHGKGSGPSRAVTTDRGPGRGVGVMNQEPRVGRASYIVSRVALGTSQARDFASVVAMTFTPRPELHMVSGPIRELNESRTTFPRQYLRRSAAAHRWASYRLSLRRKSTASSSWGI